MTVDVHALAGAYALDALPEEERAFFERHLEACDACRSEVAGLLETAAFLAQDAVEPPPPALRERLLARVDVTRQLPPAQTTPVTLPRRGVLARLRPLLAPLAASLALAVVILTAVTANLINRIDELEREFAAQDTGELVAVLGADDARTVELGKRGRSSARFVYSAARNAAVLVSDGMPSPGRRKTYELWLFHDGQPTPVALFEPGDDGRSLAVMSGQIRGAEAAAVTVEPDGGSPRPTGPVVASGEL